MSLPRVMIDGFNLGLEKGTGIATYARNLSYQLHDIGHPVDVVYGVRSKVSKNKLLAEIGFFDPSQKGVTNGQVVRRLMTSYFGVKALEVPISGQVISKTYRAQLPYFDRLLNTRELFSFSRDYYKLYQRFLPVSYDNSAPIAHWTYPLPLKLKGAANIYTIHDLVPLRLPYTTLDNKRYYYKLIKKICDSADHVVTVSEASKRDIIDLMGVDESRVTNTYQSVSLPKRLTDRSRKEIDNEISSVFGLESGNYFLFYGAIEPKKNVGRLIEAYLYSRVKTPLVIVGSAAWKSDQELRLLGMSTTRKISKEKTFGKGAFNADWSSVETETVETGASRIIRIDYLPLSLLVTLISGAKSVLFPSLYEGFGLPILEAMQLGTPVMTGTEGSNPEIAGEAAYLVDPYDTRAMSQAIHELDKDATLRAQLIAAGRERAKVFSPEAHSAQLSALYARLR